MSKAEYEYEYQGIGWIAGCLEVARKSQKAVKAIGKSATFTIGGDEHCREFTLTSDEIESRTDGELLKLIAERGSH